MMTDHSDDAAAMWLSQLRVLEGDSARAERVRARCRDMMVKRQALAERSAPPDRLMGVVLQPVLVGGLGVIYLLGVVYDVIRLHTQP